MLFVIILRSPWLESSALLGSFCNNKVERFTNYRNKLWIAICKPLRTDGTYTSAQVTLINKMAISIILPPPHQIPIKLSLMRTLIIYRSTRLAHSLSQFQFPNQWNFQSRKNIWKSRPNTLNQSPFLFK